jgi:hypothetical protein
MICLNAVVGVLLAVVPGARDQPIKDTWVDGCLVGHHLHWRHLRGVQRPSKKHRAAAVFRSVDRYTSRHCRITAKAPSPCPKAGSKAPQGRPRTVTNPASKGLRRSLYASRWTSSGKPIA